MSAQAMHTILDLALAQTEYRALLFNRPFMALAGFDLTDDELRALLALRAENFEAEAEALLGAAAAVPLPVPAPA